jgi:environmental stress-induced protein Ves
MENSITILGPEEYRTSAWSGGTTTELFIFPAGSDYKKRDFLFRISTASVSIPFSKFTPLPGINRVIMIIEGEIELEHKNHYSKILHKFDVDTFTGDWESSSRGLCTDFNVMTRGNYTGIVQPIELQKGKMVEVSNLKEISFLCLYALKGVSNIKSGDKEFQINSGELFVLQDITSHQIQISAYDDCALVMAKISAL